MDEIVASGKKGAKAPRKRGKPAAADGPPPRRSARARNEVSYAEPGEADIPVKPDDGKGGVVAAAEVFDYKPGEPRSR